MKVKIVNKDGHPAATCIYDEHGENLCESGKILWPIDIHIDADRVTATIRVEVDEIEIGAEAEYLLQARQR